MNSADLLFHFCDIACLRAHKSPEWKPIHSKLLAECNKLEFPGFRQKKREIDNMTQTETILHHMKKAGSLSQREAFIQYHIQTFTARIADLRRAGHNIISKTKYHPTTGQRYTSYELAGSHAAAS